MYCFVLDLFEAQDFKKIDLLVRLVYFGLLLFFRKNLQQNALLYTTTRADLCNYFICSLLEAYLSKYFRYT